jgi:hypothetical protein
VYCRFSKTTWRQVFMTVHVCISQHCAGVQQAGFRQRNLAAPQ